MLQLFTAGTSNNYEMPNMLVLKQDQIFQFTYS